MAETGNPRFLRPVTAADADVGQAITFGPDNPLTLDCGKPLSPLTIAYMTYGTLNADALERGPDLPCADPAISSSPAPIPSPASPAGGTIMVGPGKPIDTDRFFVICANVVGGCMGTTGPGEIDPATGKPYGLDFPAGHHPRHGARAGACCSMRSASRQLLCVHRRLDGRHAGAAMGGDLIPSACVSAMPIACAARHSAQNIAFHEVGRQAIMADPDWQRRQLCAARHAARPRAWRSRAWPRTSPISPKPRCSANSAATCRTATRCRSASTPDFQIESYLRHQGMTFVDRFDANSYLYITRAMDYFDLAADYGGVLAEAFRGTQDALLPRLLHQRLAVSDRREQAHRACAECGGAPMSASSRSRATAAMTPSCWTSRKCSTPIRGFLNAAAAPRADMNALPKRSDALRPDLAAIAEMIPHGARVLDVGCGDGALLEYLVRDQERRRPRPRTVAAERERLRGARPVGRAGRRRYRSGRISVAACSTSSILTQTIQATRAAARRARAICCASASAPSSRFPISAIGACACRCSRTGACRAPRRSATPGTTRPTSISARSRISSVAGERDGRHIERALSLDENGLTHPMRADAWGPNLFADGAIFLLRGA